MFHSLRTVFAAAPHIPRLPEAEVRRRYPRYRRRVMEATFIGYSTFYLVRNNLAVVAKDMGAALHYDESMIGSILAITAITYGLGKFVMGAVSDRSNPRTFMASGLLATAVCNFLFGGIASYPLHLALWAANGFVQGMGWPPCGRTMGHWFSRKERGLWFSVWNASTNFGGGLAGALAGWAASYYGGWQYAFFVPGVIATVGAVYLFLRLCDTPQSVGLPPIEEYVTSYRGAGALVCTRCGYDLRLLTKPRCPECGEPFDEGLLLADPPPPADHERELTFQELFVDYVLTNKYVWLLAIANFFAYITRYSMLDWGPTYLREMKGATLTGGGVAILIAEWGGIPSTILLGWLSDRIGREWVWTIGSFGFTLTYLALIAMKGAPTPGWLYAMVVAQGLLGYGVTAVFGTVAFEIFEGRHYGSIFGSLSLASLAGGAAASSALIERLGNQRVDTMVDLRAYLSHATPAQRRKRGLAVGLPERPGVYLFRGPSDEVLYIGTSGNLRRRVAQYFNGSDRRSRITEMVALATRIDHVECAHPLEAGVRELRLLAAHAPPYNRRSKAPRRWWWITLSDEAFPRLTAVRAPRHDRAIGPFRSRADAADVASLLARLTGIRTCTKRLSRTGRHCCPPADVSPCPAAVNTTAAEYAEAVCRAAALLDGTDNTALNAAVQQVNALAGRGHYESAARLRDRTAAAIDALWRSQRARALAALPELVAAAPDGAGGWQLAVIRHGRLAAAGCAARGVPPLPVVDAITLGAETVLPEPAPLAGALVEETTLIARWLAAPGVRIVRVEGADDTDGWASPLASAGPWTPWSALARSARLASELSAETDPTGQQLFGRAAVDRRDSALQPVLPGRQPLSAAG